MSQPIYISFVIRSAFCAEHMRVLGRVSRINFHVTNTRRRGFCFVFDNPIRWRKTENAKEKWWKPSTVTRHADTFYNNLMDSCWLWNLIFIDSDEYPAPNIVKTKPQHEKTINEWWHADDNDDCHCFLDICHDLGALHGNIFHGRCWLEAKTRTDAWSIYEERGSFGNVWPSRQNVTVTRANR